MDLSRNPVNEGINGNPRATDHYENGALEFLLLAVAFVVFQEFAVVEM